jgi:hypothetical protein
MEKLLPRFFQFSFLMDFAILLIYKLIHLHLASISFVKKNSQLKASKFFYTFLILFKQIFTTKKYNKTIEENNKSILLFFVNSGFTLEFSVTILLKENYIKFNDFFF